MEIIYYYNKIPLRDYAKEHNLNANSIRAAILRKQLNSSKPLQEIVNECVEAYQKFEIKYYYSGIPLIDFCRKMDLNYNTIIIKYLNEYKDEDIPIDEAIEKIVDYYVENPSVRTKYYFNNQSLSKFCDENGYPYLAIYRRIKILEANGVEDSLVEEAIKKYEKRLHIDRINSIFKNLDKKNKEEIKNICTYLKISYENVLELLDMDFTYSQAINLIWYFSDKKDEDGYLLITDTKIKALFTMVNKIKKNKEIEGMGYYDLLGIYKSGLYDSRNEIIKRQKKYVNKTIKSLCGEYNIKLTKELFDDFESEIEYYLLVVISRSNLNKEGQIIRYMDLSVKGYFRKYLKKYKMSHKTVSLDGAKYSSDKGTKKEKKLVDYISDNTNPYEEIGKEQFSSKMKSVLKNLPSDDLKFIILRFQENYDYEDLSEILNITVEEVKKKELDILTKLKSNDTIKVMKK